MKKKLFLTLLTASMILGVSVSVYAEDPAPGSVQKLIASLEKQIATLKAQLEALKNAYTAVQTTSGEVKDTLKLISRLREGMSGEDVKLLQVILSSDEDTYPEGLISGFYGKLTSQAVRRFQKKHGLEQAGNVGPKTLEKLNKELEKHQILKEDDDDDNDNNRGKHGEKKHCVVVPPGHLIAPGWLRKHDGVRPLVPVCQKIPQGIASKLGLATTTPASKDRKEFAIKDVSASAITMNSARIKWMTNRASNSKVWYAISSPVTLANALFASSNLLVLNHEIPLSGLAASMTHYYIVVSSDSAGNAATSSEFMFTTSSAPGTTPPVLSGVSASSVASTSAHIVWSTNEPATSRVWYATSTPVISANMTAVNNAALLTSHDLALANLAASSMYYYLVSSADAAGNAATSSEANFLTLP